jgi:hypothetical protein
MAMAVPQGFEGLPQKPRESQRPPALTVVGRPLLRTAQQTRLRIAKIFEPVFGQRRDNNQNTDRR